MTRETTELLTVFGERFSCELQLDDELPAQIAQTLRRLQEAERPRSRTRRLCINPAS